MYFFDGSSDGYVTDPARWIRDWELFVFRGMVTDDVDSKFEEHRSTLAGMRSMCIYHSVTNEFTPEYQADAFKELIGSVHDNEMIMLHLADTTGMASPADFAQRWFNRAEAKLQTLSWIHVTEDLARLSVGPIDRKFTGNRIVKGTLPVANATTAILQNTVGHKWTFDTIQYLVGSNDSYGMTGSLGFNFTTWSHERLLARCAGGFSPVQTALGPRFIPFVPGRSG